MQTDYNSLLNELSVPGWNEFFMIATLYMFYYLYCTHVYRVRVRVRFMVFNATINDISVISWRSDLLAEENGVPRENHWSSTSHWQLYHIMFIEYNSPRAGGELTTLSVVGTDCIGSYKFNYHAITMTPHVYIVLTNVYTCTVRTWILL